MKYPNKSNIVKKHIFHPFTILLHNQVSNFLSMFCFSYYFSCFVLAIRFERCTVRFECCKIRKQDSNAQDSNVLVEFECLQTCLLPLSQMKTTCKQLCFDWLGIETEDNWKFKHFYTHFYSSWLFKRSLVWMTFLLRQ